MTDRRFIRMGPYRFDLYQVQQYSALDDDKVELFFYRDIKLTMTFKRSERDTALGFLDKCAELYAEAGDK